MYFILKLIILLEIYASSIHHKCQAYVLQIEREHEHNNNNHNNSNELSVNQLTEMEVLKPSVYIDNMVRPAEIREPSSLQEIVNYVGADRLSNTAEVMPQQQQENQHTLTYTELTKLLAFWQWAKEQNFYEMQTAQADTNNNFVTATEQ